MSQAMIDKMSEVTRMFYLRQVFLDKVHCLICSEPPTEEKIEKWDVYDFGNEALCGRCKKVIK